MEHKTSSVTNSLPRVRSESKAGRLPSRLDIRLVLIVALALIAGALAYQAPATADLRVGWIGDRLFLPASQGLGAAQQTMWYGDELADTPGERSRWTRQTATMTFPDLRPAGETQLSLRVRGWPDDVLNHITRQPQVSVSVNGTVIGTFQPANRWQNFDLTIPAALAQTSADVAIVLQTSDTFTSTQAFRDIRPKGIRVEHLSLRSAEVAGFLPVANPPLGWLALCGLLSFQALHLSLRRRTLAFVAAILLVAASAIGLALVRAWAAAALPWLTLVLLISLALVERAALIRFARKLLMRFSRGTALHYGLIAAASAWLLVVLTQLSQNIPLPAIKIFQENFPDSLLYGLLGMALVLLAVVRGKDGLPILANGFVRVIGGRRVSILVLGSFLVVWLGSIAAFNFSTNYVGHADYSDNAIVARNILNGRGWVVDYVTQFYRLYPTVTRTQETWPLLQPVWIVPFYALFGVQAWVAKLPNLIFLSLLGIGLYLVGTRLWDRRVGLLAAILVLTSHLYFKLAIYVTNDLGFTVMAFAAVWWLYRWHQQPAAQPRSWLLYASASMTGLMMWQKPATGVMMAFGMGLWFLSQRWATRPNNQQTPLWQQLWRGLLPVVIWSAIALAILSPYLVRNVLTFGTIFYSTESKDAWILGYTDWEEIYSIYMSEGNLDERGGLPDRSWILRWGFDVTLAKAERQIDAVRDYLAPPWPGLPFGLSEIFSGDERKGLLFGVGAWLSFLGLLGIMRSKRSLFTLLLLAFGPYILFLLSYWRADEERYFVIVMPWIALLAAMALWRMYDRIAAIGDGRWAPVGLILVVASCFAMLQPSWPAIAQKIQVEPQLLQADVDAYRWLRDEVDLNEVVMTRLPWQFNWHSQHPALMIPNTTDRTKLLQLARHYRVRYLVMDTMQRPNPATQKMLEQMVADSALGFTEVYRSPVFTPAVGAALVYRFPEDYGGVPALQP